MKKIGLASILWIQISSQMLFFIPANGEVYTVKKNDTLSHDIAGLLIEGPVWGKEGSLEKVLQLNPSLSKPDLIFPGETIELGDLSHSSILAPVEVLKSEPVVEVAEVKIILDCDIEFDEHDPTFEAWSAKCGRIFKIPRWELRAFLGPSYNEFTQNSTAANYQVEDTQVALNAKIDASFRLAPHWILSGSTNFTLLPVAAKFKIGGERSVYTALASSSGIRFLDLGFLIGYIPTWPPSPWTGSINAGLFYATTFIQGSYVGYQNMIGPQIVPKLSRGFSKSDTGEVFFTYAPVTNNSAYGGSNFSVGVSDLHRLENSEHRLVYSLEYSNLSLHSSDHSTVLKVNSVTALLGYTFF